MKSQGILAGGAVVLITNIVILAGVVYNRSGATPTAITLTEREMTIASSGEENTGRALRVQWQQPHIRGLEQREGPEWFDQAKLEAVGYDCHVSPTDPNAEQFYQKALPRKAYMVLEYDGAAWVTWLKEWEHDLDWTADRVRRGKRSEESLNKEKELSERVKQTASRLVAVDIGWDPAQLRRQYPDPAQFIIAPALVELQYIRTDAQKSGPRRAPFLRGVVSELLVDEIHVSLEHRAILDQIQREDKQKPRQWSRFGQLPEGVDQPRYGVTLRYGKRQEPWIVTVEKLL